MVVAKLVSVDSGDVVNTAGFVVRASGPLSRPKLPVSPEIVDKLKMYTLVALPPWA